jgi:hypothetical protein
MTILWRRSSLVILKLLFGRHIRYRERSVKGCEEYQILKTLTKTETLRRGLIRRPGTRIIANLIRKVDISLIEVTKIIGMTKVWTKVRPKVEVNVDVEDIAEVSVDAAVEEMAGAEVKAKDEIVNFY